MEKPKYTPQESTDKMYDPFEGLPFRSFAEGLGDNILPAIQAAREEQRRGKVQGRVAAERAEVAVPSVPHLLPFTRWAANNETIRNTFVADDPSTRKKARLSWYHPDDTMVSTFPVKGSLQHCRPILTCKEYCLKPALYRSILGIFF